MAARMPTIATTTSSSISVNPFDFLRFIFDPLLITFLPLSWMGCRSFRLRRSGSKRGATTGTDVEPSERAVQPCVVVRPGCIHRYGGRAHRHESNATERHSMTDPSWKIGRYIE